MDSISATPDPAVTRLPLFTGTSEVVTKWVATADPADLGQALEIGVPLMMRILAAGSRVAGSTCGTDDDTGETDVPVYKGQIGEAVVEAALRERFGSVENVTKVSKSGDLTLFIQHRKIVVEVKNYNTVVPTTGVEKFRRDLGATNACGGVFVSLRSPIAAITSDYVVRHEPTDTHTVPCVYIVSSTPAAICVAVSMVSSIIQSLDYVVSELQSQDKIMSGVHEIADSLDNITRVRDELQVGTGQIMSSMSKITNGMLRVENNIRRVVDSMKGELFHTCTRGDTAEVLKTMVAFARCSPAAQSHTLTIMQAVESTLHEDQLGGPVWRLSTKKCVNIASGIGVTYYAQRIEVSIPRRRVSDTTMLTALTTFGRPARIGDAFCIALNGVTVDWICEAICGLA